MGIELPVTIPDSLRWSRAQDTFNAWRGRCLHSFTNAEAEVSEAFLRLAATQTSPIYPHLAGQRSAAVLLAANDVGSRPDPSLVKAMTGFQHYDTLRAALCHGRVTITLDRADRWTAIFRLTVFRHKKFDRVVTVVEEREAEGIITDLMRDVQRLVQRLRGWCVE